MAGAGGVHALREYGYETVGVEIEPEWVHMSPFTQVGNALALNFDDEAFDAIVVSPCYGNRLADKHKAKDDSVRRSYTHDLGRELSGNNSGALQWGDAYREFHIDAWFEAVRVLKYGGRFLLNISDHIRGGVRQPVTAWHINQLTTYCDLALVDIVHVGTPRLRQGSNSKARVDGEFVVVLQK